MRAVVVALVLIAASGIVLAADPQPAPQEIINLDLPPLVRFNNMINKYKSRAVPVLKWLDSILPPEIYKYLDPILASLDNYFPAPYADELRGIASQTGDVGLTLGKLVLMNIIYDISAGCTSIVAQRSDGTMLHARNLDYGIPGLRNLTVQVDFQRNNKTIYRSTTFAGYIGVLTGVRPGAWSVTVNERDRDAEGTPIDNIIEALKGGWSIGFFLRQQLEQRENYQEAIQVLQHLPLMAPVYLTVAGANAGEGCIITRDREKPDDVWHVTAPSMWNIIETNYDHWKPSGDNRLATAMAGMAQYNWTTVDLPAIYKVLSTPPVLNSETMYTTLINPATGSMDSAVRYDMGP